MTFQPVVPFGGVAGWAYLQRTRDAQQETFNNSPQIRRNVDAFVDRIPNVSSAAELVEDRQLLSVALGAFGLDEDISNTFFIQKVLEDGSLNPDSLANRLSDKRYLSMAEAFGFDLTPPRTVLSNFAGDITRDYSDRQFEIALGNTAPDMRLALTLQRELPDLASASLSDDAKWFTIMANPPLRAVFERAFRLPSAIGALDIDRQLSIFKEKARAWFGAEAVTQFQDPDLRDELMRQYLVSSDTIPQSLPTVRGSAALAILQARPTGVTLGPLL